MQLSKLLCSLASASVGAFPLTGEGGTRSVTDEGEKNLSFFFQAFESNSGRFDDERGEGRIFASNGVFDSFDNIIGKADTFRCGRRNNRYFEFLH